jgi:hypothetical protein
MQAAPEILLKRHYSQHTEEYAFAMLCWMLFAISVPYPQYIQATELAAQKREVQAMLLRVVNGMRPTLDQIGQGAIYQPVKTLLSQMWHADPAKRSGFGEAITVLKAFEEAMQMQELEKEVSKVKVSPSTT